MTTETPTRETVEEYLDLMRRIRAGYMVRLRRDLLAGRPTEKLQVQVDACDRYLAMYEEALAE